MKKKLLAMVLAAATAMTMLAGCGGDKKEAPEDKKEASAEAGTEEKKEEDKKELDKVRVAYMPNYASLWVVKTAQEKGYFEEEGIEVELTKFDDGLYINRSYGRWFHGCCLYRTWCSFLGNQRKCRCILLPAVGRCGLCYGSEI